MHKYTRTHTYTHLHTHTPTHTHTHTHTQEMERRLEEAKQQGIKLERDFYDGKAVGVFDLSKFGYSNADLSALKAVFDLLQV